MSIYFISIPLILITIWWHRSNRTDVMQTKALSPLAERIKALVIQTSSALTVILGFSIVGNIPFLGGILPVVDDTLKYVIDQFDTIAESITAVIAFIGGLVNLWKRNKNEAAVKMYLNQMNKEILVKNEAAPMAKGAVAIDMYRHLQ